MNRPLLPLLLAFLPPAAGCSLGDMYDKEYVLYDSTTPAAKGSPARQAAGAKEAEAEARRADPAAAVPADPRVAAVSAEGDVDRIFLLENLLDELDRAMRESVGDVQRLHEKRTQIEAEIAWRKAEVGPLYARARALRIERLARFPTVLK